MTDTLESSLATYSGVGGVIGLIVAVLLTVLKHCLKKYVFACDCELRSKPQQKRIKWNPEQGSVKSEVIKNTAESPAESLHELSYFVGKPVEVASSDVEAGILKPAYRCRSW
eukprot:5834178-Pleurochrysis_carterae.AAC.1